MAPVVYVDLLNLACCAIEAARGLEQWHSWAAESESVSVITSGQFDTDNGSAPDLSVLVVAGTVTHSQASLVTQRYEAMPEPRAVVAFGVCTISGGPYWDSYSVLPGIEGLIDVDAMVPGCPPLPEDVAIALDEVVTTKLRLKAGSNGLVSAVRDVKAEVHA